MAALWIVLLLLVVATFAAIMLTPRQDERPVNEEVWQRALAREDSAIGSGMLRMAKPLSRSSYLRDQARHPAWQGLHEKIVSSGLYGGSLEVFLSYQALSLVVGIALVLVALAAEGNLLLRLGVAAIAIVIVLMPYNKVSSTLRKRTDEVNEALPEFVELLLMPLGSGMSVKQALIFTAMHTEGVVANEVRWMIDSMAQPTRPEEEYFRDAGLRLGTPEASAFFNALGQSHVEGVKVAANLTRQAEALRNMAFQNRRKKIRVLPVTLIVAFAIHFLPMIFVMTLLPLMYSLMSI